LLQHFIFAIVALVIQFKLEPPHLGKEDDVIWEWNHATQEVFQLPESEVVGKGVLICMNDADYSTFYISDHLKRAIPKLVYMHTFCGIAQFIGLYSSSTNKKSFIHNVLNMMTVPLYQFSIL
jgi:hypothetical protein